MRIAALAGVLASGFILLGAGCGEPHPRWQVCDEFADATAAFVEEADNQTVGRGEVPPGEADHLVRAIALADVAAQDLEPGETRTLLEEFSERAKFYLVTGESAAWMAMADTADQLCPRDNS